MAFVEDSSSFFLRVNDAFKSFDSDSDGFLNVKEMKAVVFAVCGERLSKAEIEDITTTDNYDARGISLDNAIKIVERRNNIRNKDLDVLNAFKSFDKTRKGYITVEDLHHVFSLLFKQMPKDTIDQLDMSGQSMVDFNTFKTIVTRGSTFLYNNDTLSAINKP